MEHIKKRRFKKMIISQNYKIKKIILSHNFIFVKCEKWNDDEYGIRNKDF